MAPRETENNAYAKFWGDKQRALWYVMVFLEWSITTYVSLSEEARHLKKCTLSSRLLHFKITTVNIFNFEYEDP